MLKPSRWTECPVCRNARWVCEDHPDRPWGIGGGCECGGAGMPCSACNPCDREHPPELPEDYQSFVKRNQDDLEWVAFEPGDEPSVLTADLCDHFGGCEKCPGFISLGELPLAIGTTLKSGLSNPKEPVFCIHWCHKVPHEA